MQSIKVGEYLRDREAITDSAIIFVDDPAMFWKLGGAQVERRIQNLLFPAG